MNLSQRICNTTLQSSSPMICTRCLALAGAGWYHGKWIACLHNFTLPSANRERSREIVHHFPHRDPDKGLAMHVERIVHATCETWMLGPCSRNRKLHAAHIQAHRALSPSLFPGYHTAVSVTFLDYMFKWRTVVITSYGHKHSKVHWSPSFPSVLICSTGMPTMAHSCLVQCLRPRNIFRGAITDSIT